MRSSFSVVLLAFAAGCTRPSSSSTAPAASTSAPAAPSSSPAEPSVADPGTALLAKYGYAARGPTEDITLDLPANLDESAAATHYQAASREVGLDLTPHAGKKVLVRKYDVGRTTKSGFHVFAYVALAHGAAVGAWVATDGPIAPGITSLSNAKVMDW